MKAQIPVHDLLELKEKKIPFQLHTLEATAQYNSTISHRHSYYEIFFFTKGGGEHFIDFEWIPIQDHSIHFVSPGQIHQVKRSADSYGYVLLFSDDFYLMEQSNKNLLFDCPLLNNNTDHPILNLDEKTFTVLNQFAHLIYGELEKQEKGSKEICLAYLHIIIAKASQLFDKINPNHALKTNSTYQQFKLLLEQNYHSLQSPKNYAELISISEKTLNRHLLASSGKSALHHIQARVLLETKRLLINSESSLKEIAYALNFHDPSHFTKFFKDKTGTTPSKFRSETKT